MAVGSRANWEEMNTQTKKQSSFEKSKADIADNVAKAKATPKEPIKKPETVDGGMVGLSIKRILSQEDRTKRRVREEY